MKIRYLLLIPVLFFMLFLMGCHEGTSVGVSFNNGYHYCTPCHDYFYNIHYHHYRPYFRSHDHYRRRIIVSDPVIIRERHNRQGPVRQHGGNRNRQQRNNFGRRKR